MTRAETRGRTARSAPATVAGLTLVAALLTGLSSAPAGAADDTCVGRGEYRAIKGGMSIQKLAEVLNGQLPFADVAAHGRQHLRWYAACDAWQPEKDVVVRYRLPVVGRRTVMGKRLDVYVAETVVVQPGPDGPRTKPH